MQIQVDSVVQVRTHLLTSDFSSSIRKERQFLRVFPNHTMLTSPPNVRHILWCFRSQFIFAGRDPKNLTIAATVGNSTQWQRTQFSTPMAETQLSACMVQYQILNCMVGLQLLNTMVGPQLLNTMVGPQLNLFSKSSKFSAHLFWAWCHPHSSPISCLVFIMTMVIVISFAHQRKLYPMLCTWTLNRNSLKPNQT